jgi:phage regulator Rha-like protein
MKSLVLLEKNEPVTTTEIISKELNVDHRSLMQLVKKYEIKFNELGIVTFEMRKLKGAGRPFNYAVLNESQTYFLIMLTRNVGNVSEFKKKFVVEFMKMKKAINEIQIRQNDKSWQELRKQVKVSRLETTDTIKRFVQYCTEAGSKKAFTYYGHLTNAEYKALFLLEQKFDNLRDLLTDRQLSMLKTADEIVIIALEDGMSREMEYHAIYKMAKERLETFASIMPKTPVIMLNETKKLVDGKQVVITKKGEEKC